MGSGALAAPAQAAFVGAAQARASARARRIPGGDLERRAVDLPLLEALAAVDRLRPARGWSVARGGRSCLAICTSSTVAAAFERIVSGSAAVARSRASWAACGSLNEPTWITQLPSGGVSGAAAARHRGAGDAERPRRRGGAGGGRREARPWRPRRRAATSRRSWRRDRTWRRCSAPTAACAIEVQGESRMACGDREAAIHQVGHHAVALAGAVAAHHDADQAAVVAHRRHHEIEARGVGVAGLQAVGAVVGAEHAIVVLERCGRDRCSSAPRRPDSSAG